MSGGKEMKKFRRELQREGWRLEPCKKQYKAHHPKGGTIYMSISPSDTYAAQAARRDVMKLKKQHGEA